MTAGPSRYDHLYMQEFLSGALGKAQGKDGLGDEAQIVAVDFVVNHKGQELQCTGVKKKETCTFEIPFNGTARPPPGTKRVEAPAGKQISHLTFKDFRLESAKVCGLDVDLRESVALVSSLTRGCLCKAFGVWACFQLW